MQEEVDLHSFVHTHTHTQLLSFEEIPVDFFISLYLFLCCNAADLVMEDRSQLAQNKKYNIWQKGSFVNDTNNVSQFSSEKLHD